jgi:hypothetical protein
MPTQTARDERLGVPFACSQIAEVLGLEAAGLASFVETLERQRGAVGTNDHAALDATLVDIDRLLLRLTRLREQRQRMIDEWSGESGLAVSAFIERFGADVPASLPAGHRRLQQAALDAARAARLNSVVLRRVLESERAFIHSLFHDGPGGGYAALAGSRAAGLLLDREA